MSKTKTNIRTPKDSRVQSSRTSGCVAARTIPTQSPDSGDICTSDVEGDTWPEREEIADKRKAPSCSHCGMMTIPGWICTRCEVAATDELERSEKYRRALEKIIAEGDRQMLESNIFAIAEEALK